MPGGSSVFAPGLGAGCCAGAGAGAGGSEGDGDVDGEVLGVGSTLTEGVGSVPGVGSSAAAAVAPTAIDRAAMAIATEKLAARRAIGRVTLYLPVRWAVGSGWRRRSRPAPRLTGGDVRKRDRMKGCARYTSDIKVFVAYAEHISSNRQVRLIRAYPAATNRAAAGR